MQIRSSDVWLKSNITNLLRALALTAQASPDDYSRGYAAAIAAVAVALGIAPADVVDITRFGLMEER
jgi:hypothetical protein